MLWQLYSRLWSFRYSSDSVQCGPSSEENIPSPPRNWTQVAFSGVSHFATFGYILQGPDILKQCNGRAEKIWLWRYVLPASQELHCACVWCLPSRQQWVLVRLKDCAVTLIYLHCKCSSPLHYNDICPPPPPAAHVSWSLAANWITVYDECLRGILPPTSLSLTILPSALLTHDDGLWTMKETHLLKSVPFVHWRIHFAVKNIFASLQCFLNFYVLGKVWP